MMSVMPALKRVSAPRLLSWLCLLLLGFASCASAQNGAHVSLRSSTGSFNIPHDQPFTLTADTAFSPGCSAAHASHTWTVDGTIVTTHGKALVLKFGVDGTHVVGCQVMTSEGCSGGQTVTIYSVPIGGGGGGGGGGTGCTFSAGATPNPACVDQNITFAAGYSGTGCATIVDWYFDGDASIRYPGASMVHSFSGAGQHTGTVTDSNGATFTVQVTVNAPGILNLQAGGAPTPACVGESVQFSASASEGCGSATITYTWHFDDGTPNVTGASVSHAFQTSGQHTATVTASDGANASQQTTTTVQVNAPGVTGVSLSANSTSVCPRAPVTFTAAATDNCPRQPLTYTWHFDDGTADVTDALTSVQHAFASPGQHVAQVTASDGSTSMSATATVTVTQPVITFDAGPASVTATTCDTVDFTASASGTCLGAVSFTWHFDDGSPDQTGSSAHRKFSSTGDHLVTVSGGDGYTSGARNITVHVNPCSTSKDPTPGVGLSSDPWAPASCPISLQINKRTGNAKATKHDPVATRGYPITVNIHFNSQAVELDRPMGNATFTYDIHLATQTVYDTACNGATHRMLVDGDATRYDFGPVAGGLSPPPGFFSQLSVSGSGWTLQNAGPPEDISSAGSFRYDFDSQGRLTRLTDPANNAQVLAYGGPGGRLSSVTDLNTGKQAAFLYTGSAIAQVVENNTVATNLTYAGGFLTQVAVSSGMAAVESIQLTYNGDATFHTITRDSDPATAVTFSYTPWPSRDCQHQVMLANATDADGRQTRIDWSQPAAEGVAESVYWTNAKGGLFRCDFSGSGDLVRVVTPTLTGATAPTTLSFTYDAQHNCTSASDGVATVTATYDALGNVLSASQGGVTCSATYAGSDLLTTLDPLSHTTAVVYGDNALPHVPTGLTDESGLTWWATHNPFGQLLTANPPAGSPTGQSSVVYDESNGPNRGYPLYATDGNGDLVSFDSYDGLGDLTSISTYPLHGNTNVRNTSFFFYDAVQRLTAVQNPDGTTSQAFYSGHNLAYTLDEKGTRYDYAYCAPCGLLTSIAGPLGWGLHWSYDGDKDLTSFTDARGKVTTYGYGSAGDLNRITYPDGSHEDVRYDQYGRLTQAINGRGTAVALGYDASGRLSSINAPTTSPGPGVVSPGNSRAFSYYADGSVSSFTDEVGTTSFTYTPRGQVETVTYDYRTSGLPTVQTLTYAYNPDGSRHSLTWTIPPSASVGTWTYNYDAGGRLTSVTNPYNQSTGWNYDGEGKLTSQVNSNGTSTVYAYNQARGWPTNITYKRGFATLSFYDLAYDNGQNTAGLLTGVGEQDGSTVAYGYDALYRLTSESRQGTNPTNHTWAYDLAGNITRYDGVAASYDDANKQVGFTPYDGDGEPQFVPGGQAQWDALGQLRDVQGSANGQFFDHGYWYDALGHLVYSTSLGHKGFSVFDGDLLLGELFVNAPDSWGVSAVYTWGAAGLASETVGGASYWYHFGPQGETRLLTDGTGAVAATYNYSAYGALSASTGSVSNEFRYGGQFGYRTFSNGNPTSVLLLCGARWYSPAIGRWLSRDPSGYDGGPNLYEYCEGDPVNWFDSTGNSLEDIKGFLRGAGRELGKVAFGVFEANPGITAARLVRIPEPRIVGQIRNELYAIPLTGAEENGRDMARILSVGLSTMPEPPTIPVLSPKSPSIVTSCPKKVAEEGIYEVPLANGRTYVGQSGTITQRLAHHVASKKITPQEAAAAIRTEVKGGKTAREVAEQLRIDSHGGIRGGKLTNVRNPIGDKRLRLLPRGYKKP